MKKIIKYGVTAFGLVWTLLFLYLCTKSNFNLGNLLVVLLGVIITVWCHLPQNSIIIIAKAFFLVGCCAYIIIGIFIYTQGQKQDVTFEEDAVVVLGCGVRGTVPTLDLKLRLDKAIEYSDKNSGCVICVCGGQGPGEDIPEAEAMKAYLIEKGIDENRIVVEDKSASTYENFKFAKELLDEHFNNVDYSIVYITNDFHTYRAGLYAKESGFKEINSYPTKTNAYSAIQNYMREVLAVVYKVVLD